MQNEQIKYKLEFDSYYVNTFINQYVIDYLCSII